MQWAIENKLSNSYFASIDTGWASHKWCKRVEKAQAYAFSHDITHIHLKSPLSFAALVRQRQEFPSSTFKWCSSLLKGSVLNAWLDEIDPECTAIILLAKQKISSRLYNTLPEFIEESEHYGGRKVWHPLLELTLLQRNELIARTPFELLATRSLECNPCIYTTTQELSDMHSADRDKLSVLEQQLGQTMCADNHITHRNKIKMINGAKQSSQSKEVNFLETVSMGCGSPWGCGE